MLWRTFASRGCHSSLRIRQSLELNCTTAVTIVKLNRRPASFVSKTGAGDLRLFTNRELLEDGASGRVENSQIQVRGLVRSIRKQKKHAFAVISDGSTASTLQAVLTPEQATNITNGTYVDLVGTWKKSLGAGQSHELLVDEIKNVGESVAEDNPIQKQDMTSDYLRNIPHLRVRTPQYSLLARARSQVIASVHDYFRQADHSVVFVHPPSVTSSDCEGAGETFVVQPRNYPPRRTDAHGLTIGGPDEYFGGRKYLTVSSQLHLEAYAAELGDVWTLAPTFRAEPSDTSRHLSEFYMLEAEFRGTRSLHALLEHVRNLVRHIATSFEANSIIADFELIQKDLDIGERLQRLSGDWDLLTYSEVMSELTEAYEGNSDLFEHEPRWGQGLQLEHERWAVANLAHNRPLFVTHYPQRAKPFYMLPSGLDAPNSQDPRATVACFDLLLPFGCCEVAGGSLREHRLEYLIANMRAAGQLKHAKKSADQPRYPYLARDESLGPMQWYADLRRFGSSPHGGYGLGFDRLMGYLTAASSVRDVVPFPRYYGRAEC